MATEEQKKKHAEYSRNYRRTHKDNAELHRLRSKRYYDRHKSNNRGDTHLPNIKTSAAITLKRGVLTHYGNGKLSCVKCGETDIDCLSLDHVNNDAHHRQNGGRVGGYQLYQKLMNQNYPTGYQTLCHNCNMKKAIEFCRKNGGNKKGTPKENHLPLFDFIRPEIEEYPEILYLHKLRLIPQ
jgi:hypothetical protein